MQRPWIHLHFLKVIVYYVPFLLKLTPIMIVYKEFLHNCIQITFVSTIWNCIRCVDNIQLQQKLITVNINQNIRMWSIMIHIIHYQDFVAYENYCHHNKRYFHKSHCLCVAEELITLKNVIHCLWLQKIISNYLYHDGSIDEVNCGLFLFNTSVTVTNTKVT